ncbi:MAG: transposase [Oscillatoria sp. PMC 1051.18]|nr:transposase [Oscillatoria sp. PMC 1050.18]MEC5030479.1 transposase [Oscillatoria sp. PMC 1051.18]
MEQVLTLVVKLQADEKQQQLLSQTAIAFADACTWINTHVNSKLTNRNSIQAVCYHKVKAKFGLSANHVVRACARVAANRLSAKHKGRKVRGFKPTSFECDARTFRLIEEGWLISISTVGKRTKLALRASTYHRGKLKDKNPTSAQICQHRDGNWYAHIQIKDNAPKPVKTDKVIGVDFGRRDIAVTSSGQSWSGKKIQNKRDQFSRVQASLQKKADATPRRRTAQGNAYQAASQGTRSTRRRCRQTLKRLSGRERRFQSWLNHNISKAIIDKAKHQQALVAIEDLSGIRERTNEKPRSKTERRRSNSWAFDRLRSFLEYKGIKEGVEVIAIPPAYTSQTCHKCKHLGIRGGKYFRCTNPQCQHYGDADVNASLVIALWGCSFNQPGGSQLLSCTIASGLLKASTLIGEVVYSIS